MKTKILHSRRAFLPVLFTLLLSIAGVMNAFSQDRIAKSDIQSFNVDSKMGVALGNEVSPSSASYFAPQTAKSVVANRYDDIEDGETMWTYYDLQSNGWCSNRMYQLPNGSVAVAATMSHQPNLYASDRGTGYNFYNAETYQWQDMPQARVEDMRTGWPTIAQWGDNGEILISHAPLRCWTREVAGQGEWVFRGELPASPEGYPYFDDASWPRVATSGDHHNIIHVIADIQHSGDVLEHHQVYYRSTDAENWTCTYSPLAQDNEETGHYSADNYIITANGHNVAMIYGNDVHSHVVMYKSTNDGQTWNRTVIWQNPYYGYDWETDPNSIYTDTVYGPASLAIALDNNGVAHVAMSAYEYIHSELGSNYTTFSGRSVDGIYYWNDTQTAPIQSENGNPHDALRLWWPDEENPGFIIKHDDPAKWIGYIPMYDGYTFDNDYFFHNNDYFSKIRSGASAWPALSIDPMGNIACAYSSPCVERLDDNGAYYYRSIYVSYRDVNEGYWHQAEDDITDPDINFINLISENIYTNSVDNTTIPGEFWFSFQSDDQIGLYWGSDASQYDASENQIHVVKVVHTPGTSAYKYISVTANPAEGGTVSGGGAYEIGQTCTVTATPLGEYEFGNWTENGNPVSNQPSYTFTITSNRTLVANFTNPNFINFADPNVEARCVELWDTNGDGHLSYDEAAAVTDLNQAFQYWGGITSFNELQYFTGLTYLREFEFYGCGNLASIIIPESVTSIGYEAFEYCHSLNSITIPESVTYIDWEVFYSSGLTTMNFNATNCSVDGSWLYGCSLTNLTIGDNVQVIPDNFVSGQSSLVGELVIPESVISIGSSAFANCSGFTGTLTLPASVTSVGGGAFSNCTGFTGTLTLPASLTSIGSSAFENCSGLTGTLTIPAQMTSIDTRAFANTGFSTVNFNATNCTYMGNDYNNPVFADCSNLTTLNIGENVGIIPEFAFAYCSNLTGNLTIPNSVTTIGRFAFRGCTGYNGSLTLPNNLTWIGNNAFYYCSFTGQLTIPNSVEYIGVGAFIDCDFTGTLTIGTGVTKIGVSAFRHCTGITTVQYNAINWQVDMYNGDEFEGSWYYGDYFVSYSVFNECSNLSTIIIGEQVQNIPPCAFLKCSSVTGALTIPSSVQSIGIYAFGMMGISTVNFNATNCADFGWESWWDDDAGVSYDGSAFLQCNNLGTVNFGNNVQRIPANAFNGYSSLTGALVIPSSVMEIGYRAFSGCSGLTGALTLPNAVTSIGGYAFNGCGGLTSSLVIPNSVSYIGEYAFNGCNGLEGILTIGNSVSEIGSYAFNNTALTTLNYQAANCTSIGRYDWDGNASVFYNFTTVDFGDNVESIPNGAFRGCTNLTGNLVLPNSLTTIGDQAFYNCYGFEDIVMGNSVETIGSEAFRNCGGFRGELTLPETLQSVGTSAFAGCNEISTVNYNAVNCQTMGNASQNVFADCLSLAHIRIGANVQSIPNYAFKPCFLVTDMSVAAEVPPVISASTFGTVSRNIPVSVPLGSSPAYRTAPYWEEFFHITEDYSSSPYTYHWSVNVHQFADNMTVTGIIQVEGVEQAVPSLEIGAFCEGECRGRQLLTYYPQVDRYLVFLMLYGEEGDMFTFRLYDHEAGEELTAGCASVLTFEADAIVGSFLDPHVFNFTDMQLTQFSQGWNWWCTYVELAGMDGLSQLEESLGENGITIRSQAGYTDYYAGYGWYGSLSSINNESSYKIKASAPCVAAMAGGTAVPSQHPITLDQGWTWMGYLPSFALDINTALAGLEATQGDKVKSQAGYSDYYPGYGWFGSLNTIEPGMGLMYYSTNGEAVTFTYPDGNRGGELKQNLTAEDNHWKPNTCAYPDNMTVMAVVELDEEELATENYELAAFAANGECRGSVRLTFAEPLNRHVAFLTIAGKDAAELSFRLYDTETNEEYYAAEESLDFVANAIVGEADDLYTIHFRGTAGMDDLDGKVKVYPNPVASGQRFHISVFDSKNQEIRVEVVNALGVVVWAEDMNGLSLEMTAPKTSGLYTVRVITKDKGILYHKLIVE